MSITRTRHLGFSILELAVVLGVIALIAGAGISMASGALKAADRVTTQERLNTIKIALDSYGKTYGYLPCPASRILAPSSALFGVESRSGNACTAIATGVVLNGSAWLGALPVRSLGLPDNYAWDAWNGKLTYGVSGQAIANPTRYSLTMAGLDVRSGDRTTFNTLTRRVVTSSASGTASNNGAGRLRLDMGFPLQLAVNTPVHIQSTNYRGSYLATAVSGNTVDFASVPFTVADTGARIHFAQANGFSAAYVVVSHGPDGRGAFTANGTSIPANKLCNTSASANSSPQPCTSNATTSCIDIENCNDDNIFFDTTYNDGAQPTLYFDDYVVWGGNSNFRAPIDPTLYTNNATSTCPAGTCEAWCAACITNYPGGGTTVPPATFTSATVLCRKIITSSTTTCNASCFWGGVTASGFVKCP